MDTQFDYLSEPDPNIKYYYFPRIRSDIFTHLMKLVLMVKTHHEAINSIEKLTKDTRNLDNVNKDGLTALMIACANSICSVIIR